MKNKIKNLLIHISNITKFKKDYTFIYYHEVTEGEGDSYQKINKDSFIDQMKYLKKNGYTTILLDEIEVERRKRKEKEVCIMFDDGYKDNYEIVFPIMKELNLKFNIFLETNAVDNDNAYITWGNVREMYNSKLVDFGLHTHSHIDARFINQENFDKEILKPNQLFKYYLSKEAKDFCFPFGAYNDRTIKLFINKTSYTKLYTSDGNGKKNLRDKVVLGRVGIEGKDTLKDFELKLAGGYDNFLYFNYLYKRLFKNSEKLEYTKYS